MLWHSSSATGHELAVESYDSYHEAMVNEMSYTDIKNNLSDVFEMAARGEPTYGRTRNKRTIAIVPAEVLDTYLRDETRELRDLIHAREGEPTTDLTAELDATVVAIQQTGAPGDTEDSES